MTIFGQPTTRAETAADQREFLTEGLIPVACQACGTQVLARKNSAAHTSIQWTCNPARSCPVYAARVAEGGTTALMDTCEKLTDSIANAAKAGRFEELL